MKKMALLLLVAAQTWMAQAQEKLVALSFDDGPNTTTTVHMLDVLKKHGVKASFFVIGKAPRFFRPPYINVDQKMYDNIKLGFICGEGCEDWLDSISVDERVKRITASARDGLIYLLHDFEGNEQTVAAVDRIIPILKKEGYRFVTVPELFKLKKVKVKRNVIYTDVMKPQHIIK